MSSKQRLALVAVGVVVLVVAAIALIDDGGRDTPLGSDVTPTTGPTGTTSGSSTGTGGGASDDSGKERTAGPGPLLESGKVTAIEVAKGEVARFRARSESADELHVHGYDIERELPAGETVELEFTADLDGVFEIELHGSGEQIGELTVSP